MRAEPEDQACSHGDDDLDQGRELGFEAARFEGDIDTFQAFRFQAALLIVLTREGPDDADGGDHFLNVGNDFAFLFAKFAGGFLDFARVGVDESDEDRRHGKRDQSESPVQVEHHGDHADERDAVDQNAQQAAGDESSGRNRYRW